MNLCMALNWRSETSYTLVVQLLAADGAVISLIDRYFEPKNRLSLFHFCWVPMTVLSCIPIVVGMSITRLRYVVRSFSLFTTTTLHGTDDLSAPSTASPSLAKRDCRKRLRMAVMVVLQAVTLPTVFASSPMAIRLHKRKSSRTPQRVTGISFLRRSPFGSRSPIWSSSQPHLRWSTVHRFFLLVLKRADRSYRSERLRLRAREMHRQAQPPRLAHPHGCL